MIGIVSSNFSKSQSLQSYVPTYKQTYTCICIYIYMYAHTYSIYNSICSYTLCKTTLKILLLMYTYLFVRLYSIQCNLHFTLARMQNFCCWLLWLLTVYVQQKTRCDDLFQSARRQRVYILIRCVNIFVCFCTSTELSLVTDIFICFI